VTAPIQIHYPTTFIYLPPNQRHSLRIEGGSGFYDIESHNLQVASIYIATSEVHSHHPGITQIVVYDSHNPSNQAQIELQVAQVAGLKVIEKRAEGMVGEQISFHIGLLDANSKPFDNCTGQTF